jgi:hypothetical protein
MGTIALEQAEHKSKAFPSLGDIVVFDWKAGLEASALIFIHIFSGGVVKQTSSAGQIG